MKVGVGLNHWLSFSMEGWAKMIYYTMMVSLLWLLCIWVHVISHHTTSHVGLSGHSDKPACHFWCSASSEIRWPAGWDSEFVSCRKVMGSLHQPVKSSPWWLTTASPEGAKSVTDWNHGLGNMLSMPNTHLFPCASEGACWELALQHIQMERQLP